LVHVGVDFGFHVMVLADVTIKWHYHWEKPPFFDNRQVYIIDTTASRQLLMQDDEDHEKHAYGWTSQFSQDGRAGSVNLGGRGQLRDWQIFNRAHEGRLPGYTFPSIWAQRGNEKHVAPVCVFSAQGTAR
jgi:hypothetical protein